MSSDFNIWVVREGEHDISAAQLHGRLMPPIFGRGVSPHDVAGQEAIIKRDVLPFSKPEDHILTVGPQVMVMTLAALMMREHGRVNYLVWNRHRSEYVRKYVGNRPIDRQP